MKALYPLLAGLGLLAASVGAEASSTPPHHGDEFPNYAALDPATMGPAKSSAADAGTLGAAPGDLDPFDGAVVGNYILAAATQPDGKTVIAGFFSSVLGQPRNNIARLNADGTLDAGFNPNASSFVTTVAVQADGKILLGGSFTAVGGTARNYVARVTATGALDASFNPDPNGSLSSLALEAALQGHTTLEEVDRVAV